MKHTMDDDQVQQLREEAENNLQGWKRALADYENYRKEVEGLLERRRQHTAAEIIADLAPILDNFRTALAHVSETERASQWYIGLQHIERLFESFLVAHGIEETRPAVGTPFDHLEHEAVDTANDGSVEPHQITRLVAPGYRLAGTVIKPAKV